MHHSNLTDEIAATFWSLLQDNAGASDTPGLQGVHENSMAGDPFIANPDLFNSGNDTAFTPTLSSSMETSFTGQLNYSHPVSNQGFDRRHRLTLPYHRVMLMLGPCRPKVSPVLLLQQPFVFTGCEGFPDASSAIPNLVGNWSAGVSLNTADSAAATSHVSANATDK